MKFEWILSSREAKRRGISSIRMRSLAVLGMTAASLFFATNTHAQSLQQPVKAKHAMVVSEQHLASQVGASILMSGGNAVDAAVAVGYALAVVNPCCGNIGGGGFMTIHLADGKNIFLNFRERAPLAAKENMYLDANGDVIPGKSTIGYSAVGVPGTVLGLDTALKKFGTMTRQQVMAPAIALAEHGYILVPGDIKLLEPMTKDFQAQPNVAAIFLKNGKPYKSGDRLVQKNLAKALKEILQKGPDAFYKGNIATEIVEASQKNGGILSLDDFTKYRVEQLFPLTCNYRGYNIISAPPPSSGGVAMCEILNVLEDYPLKTLGHNSVQSIHYITEAMRYAFYDRNNQLGDPDFVENPLENLLSIEHADQARQHIIDVKATPSSEMGKGPMMQEGVNTTHYSVIDRKGNAVAVTYTLNSFFGAKVIAGNTGFFLNDEMDDFSAKPGATNQFGLVEGNKNSIQPGKRPLSSMTPTIITYKDKVFMVVGSPGGPRIISSTLLTILNVIDFKLNIQAAVDAPRFHHQWLPDTIYAEPNAFSPKLTEQLTAMGYHVTPNPTWSAVEAIYVDPDTKWIYGANDKRRSAGRAVGY